MSNQNKIDNPNTNILKGLGANVASNFDVLAVKPVGKYLSGARCVLKINGKIAAFAFGITWTIRTEAIEINTIDDYMPYELAPSRVSVSGTISGFRIPGSGPTQQLLQADALNFLHQRYIEIEVKDSQSDNLIFYTKKALVTSRQENVNSDSLSNLVLSFKAIGWADERTPTMPDDTTAYDDVVKLPNLNLPI